MDALRDQLSVTKQDLKVLGAELRSEVSAIKSDLRSEMADLRSELRSEMSGIRTDMWKMSFGVVLATATLVTFLQKLIG